MTYICITSIGIIYKCVHTHIDELENLYLTNSFYLSHQKYLHSMNIYISRISDMFGWYKLPICSQIHNEFCTVKWIDENMPNFHSSE